MHLVRTAGKKKQGVRIADDTTPESARAVEVAGAPTPSPAAEARLVAECRRNNAWRAVLALETVAFRKGAALVVRNCGRGRSMATCVSSAIEHVSSARAVAAAAASAVAVAAAAFAVVAAAAVTLLQPLLRCCCCCCCRYCYWVCCTGVLGLQTPSACCAPPIPAADPLMPCYCGTGARAKLASLTAAEGLLQAAEADLAAMTARISDAGAFSFPSLFL